MELLEDESNIAIITADKQAETALTEFENNPTPQTYADMRKAMTDYYKEQKNQANKMNDYISSNQHIGFIFRKERSQ
ncbi:MAG: hypothetical protein LBD23_06880 [Oscillospiraceae bacterium]|jgi:hypothetical protein|nr:hypothetical protein [Oscillospiraceae bacterium]